MLRFPVLKGLSGEQKVAKVLGVGFNKRQIIILMAALFAYWLLYKQLAQLLPISTAQALVIFAPLVAFAFALAFYKHDGRHLDFWIERKFTNALRPRVLLWTRERPFGILAFAAAPQAVTPAGASPGTAPGPPRGRAESPAGPPEGGHRGGKPPKGGRKGGRRRRRASRRAKPVRDLRASVQAALPTEQFLWEMLRTKDGTYLMAFEVTPVSLSLAGDTERQRIFMATAQLYNRIDFPIVEMTRSREGSVKGYATTLKEHVLDNVAPGETKLAEFARDHLAFLEHLVPLYNVYDRRGYVILPYRPENPVRRDPGKTNLFSKVLRLLGLAPKKKATVKLQEEAERAYRVLSTRVETVVDGFGRMGARLTLLSDMEFLDFVADQMSGEGERPPSSMWRPVTLEYGGYGALSERRRAGHIAKGERVRDATRARGRRPAPPAVAGGDLTLSDKVAPDAVKIHPDYVRVGDRYHATLYVYDWMPEITFGDLQGLLNIPGRVKLLKYVTPLPQHKAVNIMSAKSAELEAAEYTASDGDVRARRQRQIAHFSADVAQTELQTGQQALFDVSFLVHCEAKNREALNGLVESVKTKLAAIRVSAKLAREESWEGFISSLGFKNMLARRYANEGLLTNPLSCLFVHGSFQVHHEDGVLHGIDPTSGGLVVLDNRELNNPHMVIIGQPGMGKTVTVKALATRKRMRGHRVVIVDPEGNSGYGRVARALGGQYVVFSVGSRHRFNPLDIGDDYLNLSLLASAEDDEETTPEEARHQARAQALKGKILMLTRLVGLMLASDDGQGGLEPGQHGLVERAFTEVYADAGITDDPDTHSLTPPTMHDFFRKIRESAFEDLGSVADRLYSWEHGALKDFFGSQTNVDMTNRFLALQIAGLEGREKAAVMYALLDFLNGQLSDHREPSDCFVDEFWSLLQYPMAAKFAEQMFRSGRARNNAMCAITQEIVEFLGSPQGKLIFRISASQLLLRQNKKTADILSEFADLSEEQKRQLIALDKGEGTLIVEGNKVPLWVVISPKEERLFNTDPKREAEYERREMEAAAAERRAALDNHLGNPLGSSPEDRAMALAGPSGGAREVAFGTPTGRRLSAFGMAREAFAGEEPFVPDGDDLEPIAPDAAGGREATDEELLPAPASEATGHPEERPDGQGGHAGPHEDATHPETYGDPEGNRLGEAAAAVVDVPAAGPEGAAVHAVVGEEASVVAWSLAGILAHSAASPAAAEGDPAARRSVAFVDADGALTSSLLAPMGQARPDEILVTDVAGEPDPDLGPYLATDDLSGLKILPCPENTAGPAGRVFAAARARFDCVVVACGPAQYGYHWQQLANGSLVASGPGAAPDGLLEAVERAEVARGYAPGQGGTLIAPLGPLAPSQAAEALTARRSLFELPAPEEEAFVRSKRDASYAPLASEGVGAAFGPLVGSLVGAETTDHPDEGPADGPTPSPPPNRTEA